MTRPRYGKFAATLLVMAAGPALAQTSQQPAPKVPAVKERPYVIEQDTWTYLVEEPGVYLDRAHREIGKKQFRTAASNLRKAGAMIDREADRASNDDKTKLKRDAAALQVAANEVEAGKITNVRLFNEQLTKVRADLAGHHYLKAAEAWGKKDYAAAGASLAAAARYVQDGFSSLGEKTSADLSKALRYGEGLTKKGANTVESEFNASRSAVGTEIGKLGKALEDKKSSWPKPSPFDQGA